MNAVDDTEIATQDKDKDKMARSPQANCADSPMVDEGQMEESMREDEEPAEISNGVHFADEASVASNGQIEDNRDMDEIDVVFENGVSDHEEEPDHSRQMTSSPNTEVPFETPAESRSFEESSSGNTSNSTDSHSENPSSSPNQNSSSAEPSGTGLGLLHERGTLNESFNSSVGSESINNSNASSESDADTSLDKSVEEEDDINNESDKCENDLKDVVELAISNQPEVNIDSEMENEVRKDEPEFVVSEEENADKTSSPLTVDDADSKMAGDIENALRLCSPPNCSQAEAESLVEDSEEVESCQPIEDGRSPSVKSSEVTEDLEPTGILVSSQPISELDANKSENTEEPDNNDVKDNYVEPEVCEPPEAEDSSERNAGIVANNVEQTGKLPSPLQNAFDENATEKTTEPENVQPESVSSETEISGADINIHGVAISVQQKTAEEPELSDTQPITDVQLEEGETNDEEVDRTDDVMEYLARNAESMTRIAAPSVETESCSPKHRTEQFRLEEGELLTEAMDDDVVAQPPCERMEVDENTDFFRTGEHHPGTPSELANRQYSPQAPADDEMDDEDPNALTIDTGGWSKETSPKNDGSRKTFRFPTPSDDEDPDALTIDTSKFDKAVKTKSPPKSSNLKLIIRNNKKAKKFTISKSKKGTNRPQPSPAPAPAVPAVPSTAISSDLKCPRCPASSFSNIGTLLEHQRNCGTQSLTPAAATDPQKGPRKVYMCSSCNSYMENWDLFHHMKELHTRHICLHCLTMFSHASKLAHHMTNKHRNCINMPVGSTADFARDLPGPYTLLCVTCGLMCDVSNFETHFCSTVCSHCGLEGTHYPTCRLAPPPTVSQKKKRVKGGQRVAKKQLKMPPQPPPAPVPVTASRERTPETSQSTEPSGPLEFSPTTYHEKMMELYRGPNYARQQEKILPNARFSTAESIEDSINRVLESVASPERPAVEMPMPSPERSKADSPPPPVEPASPPISAKSSPAAELPETPVMPLAQSPPLFRKRHVSEPESSDSDKLTIELNPRRRKKNLKMADTPNFVEPPHEEDAMPVAGDDTPFTCVPLQEPLNKARVPTAMKLFLRATAITCVYCAHARKIAVNAKQLALHQLSQHRYVTLPETSTDAEKNACHAAAVKVMKEVIPSLDDVYFNAYGFDSSDKLAWRSADRVYECFHCSITTSDLREFNLHNRKMHANDMRTNRRTETHLCIMCKTRFLTYSELLCHLCRGVYVSGQIMDPHSRYRCYCCDIDPLPSSFRLMVHLRLTHTTCDMCFAVLDSQQALQAHVMGHKAIHYCYACALTYESRQELSKHIFWKHGAESAMCKRCERKKWKHAYHFCLPPAFFTCVECKLVVKSALALRVHSRIHQGVLPHSCTECSDKFISKKLLDKHIKMMHTKYVPQEETPPAVNGNGGSPHEVPSLDDAKKKPKKDKKKDLRELFDLPPVNLSESDDSSGDEQPTKTAEEGEILGEPIDSTSEAADSKSTIVPIAGVEGETTATSGPEPVVGWDGVLASLEGASKASTYPPDSPFYNLPAHRVIAIATAEHDYCRPVEVKEKLEPASNDHDYCNNSNNNNSKKHSSPRKQAKRPNRSSSSDSTSSSSSSCSSNCSCCSSTSSTESASSGEPRKMDSPRKKKLLTKGERKKTKGGLRDFDPEQKVDVCEVKVNESDLETDEAITDDEEFYELNPALRASQVLQHNRSILLDKLDVEPSPSISATSTPTSVYLQSTSKKKRKGRPLGATFGIGKIRKPKAHNPTSSPFTLMSPPPPPPAYDELNDTGESDGRRPRRKRVPLKYYGFNSEDDEDGSHHARRRERRMEVEHNTTIPASPPRPEPEPEPSNLWNPPSWRPPPVAPKVNPIKIRTGSLKQTFAKSNNSDEFHIKRAELGGFHVNGAETSNGAKSEKLYCFCQCPYDEVSEMIACDAVDCAIEWFHFECVGIMDPPKGKWYCPDCKKKAAAESEMLGIPFR